MPSSEPNVLAELWQCAPCALHTLDADGLIHRVNDTWLRWLGHDRAAVEGKLYFAEILAPESRDALEERFAGFLASGRLDNAEFVLRRKDGSVFTVALSATAIHDAEGVFVRSSSCLFDITKRKRTDQALRRLIDAAPDSTVVVDGTGKIRFANRPTERLFGYGLSELLGKSIEDLMPNRPSVAHVAERSYFTAAPQVRPMNEPHELFGCRKDGSEFPLEVSLSPLETNEGLMLAATVRDVSERRQAEFVTAQLAAIVDSSVDAIVGKTVQGVITSWNRAASRMYGYTAEEMIGQPMALLVPGDRVGEEARLRGRVIAGEPVEHFETVRLRKDGERIDVSMTLSPVCDRSGKIIGVSSVGRDFSARKQAQAAARLASERLSDAIECIDEAFAIFSRDGRLYLHNSAYRALFHDVLDGDLVGRTAGELVAAWMTAKGTDPFGQALWQIDRFAGLDLPHLVNEVGFDGRAYREVMHRTREGGVVLTISDRTDDHEREEVLRRASRAKSEFLSSMSHELRTPLNAILGFGQLLQRDKRTPLSPRQRGMVDHIIEGGDHLLRLIDDILDLARVEAGHMSISLEAVDVPGVLEQTLATLVPLASRAGVELQVAPELAEVPHVMADRTRFTQALMNFGSNAIKYSLRDGKAIFTGEVQASGNVRITVSDQGIGIPAKEQGMIFESFYRGGQEGGSIEGTGIGLAITRRLAELMGGSGRLRERGRDRVRVSGSSCPRPRGSRHRGPHRRASSIRR